MRQHHEAKENDTRRVHGTFPVHFHRLCPYHYMITRYAFQLGLIRYTRTTAVLIASWDRCHQQLLASSNRIFFFRGVRKIAKSDY
jgi:hypothetical protein